MSLVDGVNTITRKTGINGWLIVLAMVGVLAVIFRGYFESQITQCVAIIFPAYCSMQAIASPETDDDTQWLTYWTIYGIFTLVETFFGYFLHVLPFYFFIKMAFLIWLFLPNFNGATWIYNNILIIFFGKLEREVQGLKKPNKE